MSVKSLGHHLALLLFPHPSLARLEASRVLLHQTALSLYIITLSRLE